MGLMDSFLTAMNLGDNIDDDDEYLDDPDESTEPKIIKSAKASAEAENDEAPARRPSVKSPISRAKRSGNGMEVCVIKPTSYDEVPEITNTLLANRTVILNVEGLDVALAQRIIDYTTGSCYAIGGNLQKISHYIFIITPASVDISGDFQGLFGESFDLP